MISYFKNKNKIYFSKMHGLENDFMIVDCIQQNFIPSSFTIKKLSNRKTGIGFDQLLLVQKSNDSKFDFYYRIYNANGNEVEQCGNGARCFGLFVLLKKLTDKKKIFVKTVKNNLIIDFINENNIQVNMNEPNFKLDTTILLKKNTHNNFSIKLFDDSLICSIVSMGNPHCIIQVQSIHNAPVHIIGKKIQNSKIFSKGINVGFMEILSKDHIKLRVYERDVGETQSCGSGACAAVAVGIAKKLLSHNVRVDLLGGELIIKWKGFEHPLYMIGSAKHIYDGYIYI